MFGKNNFNNKINAGSEKQYHFSIRKLTIGAASVMLSAFMWNAVSNTQVHADALPQTQQTEQVQPVSSENPDGGGSTILYR